LSVGTDPGDVHELAQPRAGLLLPPGAGRPRHALSETSLCRVRCRD
jgi:hypothetical protein